MVMKMESNTTSVTVTIRVNNDDIQGSITAVKELARLLAESLQDLPPVECEPVGIAIRDDI